MSENLKNQILYDKTGSMLDIASVFRVLKCDSNLFALDSGDFNFTCTARKKVKQKTDILPGDLVRLEQENGNPVIAQVLERKNRLIRPQVSNIDQVIAVAALIPKPDYFLIDKLIINANREGIDVVLCLNKSDLSTELYTEFCAQYTNIVNRIIVTSAAEADISALSGVLKGRLSCLAGQSAVGKSSLINALLGKELQKTDVVSEKLERGKNTTTRAEIIKLSQDTYVVDTPGFSMLDIHGIKPDEFDLYYSEYVAVSPECKYHRCTHTVEPACKVRELAESNRLSHARYERYVAMHAELKSKKMF